MPPSSTLLGKTGYHVIMVERLGAAVGREKKTGEWGAGITWVHGRVPRTFL